MNLMKIKNWKNKVILFFFEKNFRKMKNIENFLWKNHKIKLPTNKFTDTYLWDFRHFQKLVWFFLFFIFTWFSFNMNLLRRPCTIFIVRFICFGNTFWKIFPILLFVDGFIWECKKFNWWIFSFLPKHFFLFS